MIELTEYSAITPVEIRRAQLAAEISVGASANRVKRRSSTSDDQVAESTSDHDLRQRLSQLDLFLERVDAAVTPVETALTSAHAIYDALTQAEVLADRALDEPAVSGTTATTTPREDLRQRVNDLLLSVDGLASDAASFGINLLAGDSETVRFSNIQDSVRRINGVDLDLAALDLEALATGAFDDAASISEVVGRIDTAIAAVSAVIAGLDAAKTSLDVQTNFYRGLSEVLGAVINPSAANQTGTTGAEAKAIGGAEEIAHVFAESILDETSLFAAPERATTGEHHTPLISLLGTSDLSDALLTGLEGSDEAFRIRTVSIA